MTDEQQKRNMQLYCGQVALLDLYRKAMAKRDFLVLRKLKLYETLDPMEAVDKDIQIEIDALSPAAKYCAQNNVSFVECGVFKNHLDNQALDRMCKQSL